MTVYETAKHALKLSWENDDLMSQETLFELQETLAKMVHTMAIHMKREDELPKEFPWLFSRNDS